MFEFWLSALHTYCFIYLFLISNTNYYVDIENGALLHAIMENDPWRSWKSRGKFLGKKCANPGVSECLRKCVSVG